MDHGFGGKGKDGMLCVMVCVCVCVKRSIFCSFVRVCAWVRVVLGAGSGGHGSVGVGVGRWAGGVGWGRGGEECNQCIGLGLTGFGCSNSTSAGEVG